MRKCYCFVLFTIIASLTRCTNSGHEPKAKLPSNIKVIKDRVSSNDSMFRKRNKELLKVYVRQKGSNRFVLNNNLNVFPNNDIESLNVLYAKDGKILAFKDIPYSESGDYFNTITYYFYDNGKTMAFKTNSKFFIEECKIKKDEDVSVTEITSFYFDNQFNTLWKDYSLMDNNHNPVDSSKCIFNYRIDEKPLKSLSEIPQLKNLHSIPKS